jgi:hypothetical protein
MFYHHFGQFVAEVQAMKLLTRYLRREYTSASRCSLHYHAVRLLDPINERTDGAATAVGASRCL